jgi:hypothetical protein
MPVIAVALVLIGMAGALVLDRLWIDAARMELLTTAEAAALAAAGRLASDDRLRQPVDWDGLIEAARRDAVDIAAVNRVAGRPVHLDPSEARDICFGRLTTDPQTDRTLFLETAHDPTSVFVTARAARRAGNALSLFFTGLTGLAAAQSSSTAEATIDNRVVGVSPLGGSTVPAWPLGILARDPSATREDTWEHQITRGNGPDLYACDPRTGDVREGGDGLPEIVLQLAPVAQSTVDRSPNVQLLDIGNGLNVRRIREQLVRGWSEDDLAGWGGTLWLDGGNVPLPAGTEPMAALRSDFEQLVGQVRIVVLYEEEETAGSDVHRVLGVGFAAGRILAVREGVNAAPELVFQPGVVGTRSAITRENVAANPYVFRLQLTD